MNQIYTLVINPTEINFNPTTVIEEILQNVNTIVTTSKFSVPLFRALGVEASFLDEPTPLVQSKLVAEITEKVEFFEDRVIVERISIESNNDGRMIPTLQISIRQGVKITW